MTGTELSYAGGSGMSSAYRRPADACLSASDLDELDALSLFADLKTNDELPTA